MKYQRIKKKPQQNKIKSQASHLYCAQPEEKSSHDHGTGRLKKEHANLKTK